MPDPYWITFASRRGAGVWTHLPNLILRMLEDRPDIGPVLLVDLGMRHEMLNHLGISPQSVPPASSLIGALERGGHLAGEVLDLGSTLRARVADERYPDVALDVVERLPAVYLLPLHVPGAPVGPISEQAALRPFKAAIESDVSLLAPGLVVLTCEGQPEGELFRVELDRHLLLRWALDSAALIVSLVRHDSVNRFEDGVTIPETIGSNPNWRPKVRVVLTRTSEEDGRNGQSNDVLLGGLPFSNSLGRAVSRGRVAYLDWVGAESSGTRGRDDYLSALRALSDRMLRELGTEGREP